MERRGRFRILVFLQALAILAPGATALSRENLYPYTIPGTKTLQTDSNGQLLPSETKLKTPIVFFDRIYENLFVS